MIFGRKTCIALAASLMSGTGSFVLAQTHAPRFRDLDHDGRLDPPEDRRLSPESRVDVLLVRMTLHRRPG